MQHQGVQGITHADTARLGIGDHLTCFYRVSAGIDIGVHNARPGFDHGNARGVAHEIDQALGAAGDGQVDGVGGLQNLRQPLPLGWRQAHGSSIQTEFRQYLVDHLDDGGIAVARVRAAFQDTGVARTQAQGGDIEGDVGAGFKNDRDDPDRHAHFLQFQPVIQRAFLQYFTHR